mgnify:CR=1 FL=1
MINHKKQSVPQSNESGFTIIESLVAIVVVSLLLAAIAPVIVLATATRLQARRVELATDAAKAYVEVVRSGRISAPPITKKAVGATTDPAPPEAPSGTLKCDRSSDYCDLPAIPAAPAIPSRLYCVNGDNQAGCQNTSFRDMVVQAFGYNSVSDQANDGYKLGVRVYRADAFKAGITLKALKDKNSSNQNIQKQNTFTGGTGLSSQQSPLVEFTTEISNNNTPFSSFCERLKQNGWTINNNPNPQSKC